MQFNLELDEEQLKGTINYENPNYDFLGNSINYFLTSESNDKPDKGYENSVTAAGVNTSFEQYKDLRASLGISASYDDLRTDGTASDSIKNKLEPFQKYWEHMDLLMIKETEHLYQPMVQLLDFLNHFQ